MTGRKLMIGFLAFVVLFAGGLFYAQTFAFYDRIEAERVEIAGESYPVSEWRGIDATTSPLKLRACFRLPEAARADLAERLSPHDRATPLLPPFWFDCYDTEAIATDLEAGRATAYLAEEEEFQGANRIVAVYPDGRAYMWRQLTPEFADQ